MSERTILHCDCNNFFASCECLERPELKTVPMAVAGDPEKRAGIVLAKNDLAKRAGVKTTDTIWQAREKCPGLVLVPPRHHLYSEISGKVNAVYREYTDFVEPASIDESYLDLTDCLAYYHKTGREFADMLRQRVREEIGITISVGVSYNKTFAKMGSDYKKPDATTVITKENFREILWVLPVTEMMFVGAAAGNRLIRAGIHTIGDLAQAPENMLQNLLGKSGIHLKRVCNGLDDSPVRCYDDRPESKSISHGTTFPKDLTDIEQAKSGVIMLSDEVARRLRQEHLKGTVIQVNVKRPDLKNISRQAALPHATFSANEIAENALKLLKALYPPSAETPIRAITVAVAKLIPESEATEQISMLDLLGSGEDSFEKRERREKLEKTIDEIQKRHGRTAIMRGFGVKKEK